MIAGKFIGVVGSPLGHDTEQSDTQHAYTQALLGADETWVSLAFDQWPKEWHKHEILVRRVRLALY